MPRSCFAVGLLVVILAGAGCPLGNGAPTLGVFPTAFNLNIHETTTTFRLYNQGGGELSWEIGATPPWIHVDPAGTGVTTTNHTEFTITVDRSGLMDGSHTGDFLITSNGGSQLVTVTLIVVPVPILEVSPAQIDFGETSASAIEICNAGTGQLDFTLQGPAWLTVEPASGSVAPGECDTVELIVNRSGQAPGLNTGTLTITSNGGNRQLALSMEVPPVVVSPAIINFGRTLSVATATISNSANQPHSFTIPPPYPAWIAEVTPNSGTVPAAGEVSVTIRADRAALQPGEFAGLLTVLSPGGDGEVRLRIEGPRPVLALTPTALEFFDADFNAEGIATSTVSVRNSGDGALTWTVLSDLPPWLSANPMAGTVATVSAPISVSVDRTLINPNRDADATAQLTVRAVVAGVTQTAVVNITARVLPPTLTATPLNLDFGTWQSQKLLAVWNSGVGTVHWNVDAASFPVWLSLSATSGSATGSETNPVIAAVNRTGLGPQVGGYAHTFQITGTDGDGAALNPVSVRVTMNVADVPTINVDTGLDAQGIPNIDEFGVPYLPFGTRTNSLTFRVANVGTGVLNWSIDTTMLPTWVTSISPSQDAIDAGAERSVTVTVSRANLPFGSVNHLLILASNDPNNRQQPLRLEMQVPKVVRIGAKPAQLSFGLFDLTSFVEVANLGDPGSVLTFAIESNKPWLFFYPETGTSIGTGLDVKDWRPINIAIDRSALDATGSVAELTIRAFETEQNGNRVFLEDVPPAVVRVSVEAADLTFETAEARLRIPSLARFILTMRDIRYQSIPLARDIIDQYIDSFAVFQDGVVMEVEESEQFLKSGTGSSGANLKTNVAIVLDYSGSMVNAASNVEDPLIATAADPLQEAYERAVSRLLDELPAHYRIALMEFHDRGQPTRVVRGLDLNNDGIITPDELPLVENDRGRRFFVTETDFTTDRNTLLARLRSIGPNIEDHGSSDVLLAALEAAERIVYEDSIYNRHPFDDADVRIVIFISDGRLTTPPGEVNDVIDALAEMKVRFLPIGWGQNVNHEPLARLAAKTGGHYYATRGQPSDTVLDAFGRQVRIPVFSEFMDHVSTDDPAVDPCDQSLPKDLKSQVVFSFVSLNEERAVETRVEAAFDNPNDDSGVCLPDQRTISGWFHQEHDFDEIVGEVRLGQISMRTDGNGTGAADLRIRLEYAPRNIRKFEFTIEAPEPFTVSQIPLDDGGIIEDWIPAAGNPIGQTMLGTYRFDAPPGTVLRYSDFGDMLNVRFDNAIVEFRVLLTVNNEIYANEDLEPKYFIYPDSIPIRLGEFLAPAFPTPSIRVAGDTLPFTYLDFDRTISSMDLEIRNVGGNFPYPADPFFDCIYHWKATPGTELKISRKEGRLNSTIDTKPDIQDPDLDGLDTLTIEANRTLAPGPYSSTVIFEYDPVCYELRNLALPDRVITVLWRVTEAVLDVESEDFVDPGVPAPVLAFGDSAGGITQLSFTVVNTGQSALAWNINTATLPHWLSLAPVSGVAPGAGNTVVVQVDRSVLDPADPPPAPYVIVIRAQNAFTEATLAEKTVVVTVEP
jgi:hypothetical protein